MSQLAISVEPAPREPVRPILARSLIAAAVLGLQTLTFLLLMLLHGRRIQLLGAFKAGLKVTQQDLATSDAALLFGSRLSLALLVASAVTFLLWFHRAHRNLRAFRTGPFEFTPSRAVWSFFIPVVSLIWPHAAMREVWQATNPSIPPFSDEPFSLTRVSVLIHLWWGLFLIQGVLGWIATFLVTANPTVDSLLLASQVNEFTLVGASTSAISASVLIYRIQQREEMLMVFLSAPGAAA
jgi:Domain of unknown function (DUF4328)